MYAKIEINGQEIEITNEHSASSYGRPVVLLGGELMGDVAEYRPDVPAVRSTLDLLADSAGVWTGERTRNRLAALAAEMIPENPRGADFDKVIAEFTRRGRETSDE